jgi:DNA (cytosine-5)-methyltransferase 1
VKHLGDVTKISGYEIEPVDVLTGGSPCQDLSVAGLRKGLKHEELDDEETTRSGLFMEQIRIAKEMRQRDRSLGRTGTDVRPRYMVWENVPGAFSSNGGRDFQTVLTEVIRVAEPKAPDVEMPNGGGKWPNSGCYYSDMGRWSVAYRTVDAQYWGTPQRRKRIALLCDFNGLTAPEILFDPQLRGETENGESDETIGSAGGERGQQIQAVEASLPGNPQQGRTEGKGTSAGTERGVGAAGERDHIKLVYDARGNGSGAISPTITGDHQNRISDYTAIALETAKKADQG